VLRALSGSGRPVRALVHRQKQVPLMREIGAAEVVVGDLRDAHALAEALRGVRAVYHICPAMQPDEADIGHGVIAAARAAGVAHFVFHSVLHPQTEALPHHTQKLRVETELVQSELPFTIMQPASYMQNILGGWARIKNEGVYTTSYGLDARMSLVDLDDVAAAAARVLTENGHQAAIYELSGPAVLTATETANILSQALGRPVSAENMNLDQWAVQMRAGGMGDYQIATLSTMFRYYAQHGFVGNPHVLAMLLNRRPTDFAGFVERVKEQG
jgi:uncharacterized protein YbjT (DUF2867 family)